MKRTFLIGGAVLVALALAVAGGTAYSSAQAERSTQQSVQALSAALNRTGLAHVENHQYHKGFLASTDDFTVVVGEGQADALRVTIHNTIRHGPLPGFAAVGQAVVDTELRWPPEVQQQLDAAFAGQKPRIHTLVGLNGATTTDIAVPAGHVAEGGDRVTWQAMTGTIHAQGQSSQTRLSWPGLTFKGSGGDGTLGTMTLESTQQDAGHGQGRLTLDRADFGDARSRLQLSGVTVGSEASRAGGFQDASVRYAVAGVSMAGQRVRDAQLTVAVRHLDAAALDRLAAVLNEQMGRSGRLDDAALQRLRGELTGAAGTLLKGGPTLGVENLSLTLPEGPVKANATLSLDDPAGIDLQTVMLSGPNAAPYALLPHLHLKARIEGTAAALSPLLAGMNIPVDALKEQGLLRQSGDSLQSDLEFAAGKLTVNGKEVPLGE